MAIEDAVREITADLRVVAGILQTPESPPEQLNEYPALLVYAGNCQHRIWTHDDGDGHAAALGVYEVKIRLYVPRKNLPDDVALLTPFMSSIPIAFLAGFDRDRFGGTVLQLGDARSPGAGTVVEGTLGPDDWGGNLLMAAFVASVSIEMPII